MTQIDAIGIEIDPNNIHSDIQASNEMDLRSAPNLIPNSEIRRTE